MSLQHTKNFKNNITYTDKSLLEIESRHFLHISHEMHPSYAIPSVNMETHYYWALQKLPTSFFVAFDTYHIFSTLKTKTLVGRSSEFASHLFDLNIYIYMYTWWNNDGTMRIIQDHEIEVEW